MSVREALNDLNDIPVTKRPIHCTDQRRKNFVVKDKQEGWIKEKGSNGGKIQKETVIKMNEYLKKELNLSDIFVCFHDDKDNCECRKPKPGMIEMAIKDHSVDVDNSIMIGDNLSDMKAGIKAKIKNNFLIADKAQTTENLNYKIFLSIKSIKPRKSQNNKSTF